MDADDNLPAVNLPQGRLGGRTAFLQTVRDALQAAAREGWQELVLCDADFADWPLGEREVVESLQAWSRGGRHFRMLAMDYSALRRDKARFVRWRQTWDHIIECRLSRDTDALAFPSVILGPAWVMQRIDRERDVLVCDKAAVRRLAVRQTVDECRRQSTPGFPASTLGL